MANTPVEIELPPLSEAEKADTAFMARLKAAGDKARETAEEKRKKREKRNAAPSLAVQATTKNAARDALRAKLDAEADAIQEEKRINAEDAQRIAEEKIALIKKAELYIQRDTKTILTMLVENPEADIETVKEFLQDSLRTAPQFASAKPRDIADGMQRMTDEIIEQVKAYATERRKLLTAKTPAEEELISANLARMSSLFKNLVAKVISDFEREKRGQPGSPTMRRNTSEFTIPARPTGPIDRVSMPIAPPASTVSAVTDYTSANVDEVVDGIFERITSGANIPMGFESTEGRSFITGLKPVDQRPSENPKPTREVSEPLIADPFADDEEELPADMHAAGSDAFEGFEIPADVVFDDNAPQLSPRHRADPFDPATFPPLAAPTPLPKAVKLPSTFPPLPTLPRKPKA